MRTRPIIVSLLLIFMLVQASPVLAHDTSSAEPAPAGAQEPVKAAEALKTPVNIPWVAYYHQKEEPQTFGPYRIVILDSETNMPVRVLANKEKLMLGYLSLTEIMATDPYFSNAKSQDLVLIENVNWPGAFAVDIRNPLWVQHLIERMIPKLLFLGFNGLLLDGLDNASELERKDPKHYGGMKEAAVNLVHAVRMHYPDITLVQNRGFDFLAETAPHLNFVLGESLYTDYDFETRTYRRVPEEQYERYATMLKEVQTQYPTLDVLTLDYWDPQDPDEIRNIYAVQRSKGFHPYVATVTLDSIVPEPK